MSERIRVGCVQMTSRAGKAANRAKAEALVARAAAQGADVVALPEKWNGIGTVADYRALAEWLPGDDPVVAEVDGLGIGLSVCYDLRFPGLYRILALRARLLTVPANFVTRRGKDHWEAYGRSLIVDPWGVVLAQAGDEETVIVAEVDLARLESIRAALPALRHRPSEAYRWPDA